MTTQPRRIVVQKFGGSSVADVEKIRRVAARVKARRNEGWALVVVVSAMGDTTDELLGLAKNISPNPPRRELDMLLTCGERISMALLSMSLHELGVEAISLTGSQSGIITDERHSQARIVEVRPFRIEQGLREGKVVVVAGYQGVSVTKEVTTLGRGGSDTTAVALAAALNAEACEIYSDVDGVFSSDPRVVPEAVKLAELSYEEMQTLASAGAKVLNAEAVQFARDKGIVIRAGSTFGGGTGSQIRELTAAAGLQSVKAIAVDTAVAVVTCENAPGLLSDVLRTLEGHGAVPRVLATTSKGTVLTASLEDAHGAEVLGAHIHQRWGTAVQLERGQGCLTCVGTNLGGVQVRKVLDTAQAMNLAVHELVLTPLQLTLVADKERLPELSVRLHQRLVMASTAD